MPLMKYQDRVVEVADDDVGYFLGVGFQPAMAPKAEREDDRDKRLLATLPGLRIVEAHVGEYRDDLTLVFDNGLKMQAKHCYENLYFEWEEPDA